MKVFVTISFLLGVLCDANKNLSLLSTAFQNVTNHLFHLETKMFIDNYGIDLGSLTQLLLKSLNEKAMPFQLKNCDVKNRKVFMNSSALLTFNSFHDVRDFNNRLKLTNEFFKPIQLFIYCRSASITDIELLVKDVQNRAPVMRLTFHDQNNPYNATSNTELSDHIQFEYFLVEEAKFVMLMTFVWYSPEKCTNLHLIEVNKFNKETVKWENDKFSIQKLETFHGCAFIFNEDFCDFGSQFYWYIPEQLETHLDYQLWDYSKLKTKFTYLKIDLLLQKGCFNENDRKLVKKGNSMTKKIIKTDRTFYYILSPVEFNPIKLATPPQGYYSEYEKLQMPFDDSVWALIAFTFVAAYTTIFILYRVKRSVRNFVIGSNITTPSLNILQIFFGLGLIILPRRNFARFLTMLFILYCLIIRTAWQGKMYEFMQKDISKPELQTVDEMIEKGYTFYMEQDFKQKFPESEIAKRGKIHQFDEYESIYDERYHLDQRILNQDFQGVVQTDPRSAYEFTRMTEGRFLQRIQEKHLFVDMCGMKFPRNHHFTEIFELKSQQLFSGGIISHYEAIYDQPTLISDRSSDILEINFKISDWVFDNRLGRLFEVYRHLPADGPKVLNLKMLEPGFVIWLSSLLLAVMAFLLEWLATLENFLVFRCILLAFYRARENIRPPISSQSTITIGSYTDSNDSSDEAKIRIDLIDGATEDCFENVETPVEAMDRADSIDNLVEASLKINQVKNIQGFLNVILPRVFGSSTQSTSSATTS